MSTAVAHSEAGRKALMLRVARRQHEARIRFWRVLAVSSFFAVAIGANLYVGAVVVMGNFNFANPFEPSKAPTQHATAQIKRPLLDGTFCRNIVFDNTTSHAIEDKVERCDGAPKQQRAPVYLYKAPAQFTWGGK